MFSCEHVLPEVSFRAEKKNLVCQSAGTLYIYMLATSISTSAHPALDQVSSASLSLLSTFPVCLAPRFSTKEYMQKPTLQHKFCQIV